MKLAISKDQLNTGLQTVQNIVGSRTTLPILSNVLLQARESALGLTATDLDVTISSTVEAKVEKDGAITLPVKRLSSIVRELVLGEIDLETDDKSVCSMRAGPSYFKVNGLAAEEFPPVPKIESAVRFVVSQEKLKRVLQRTSFAASSDESRYVLNGLFFSCKEHEVTAVATDGRRLALTHEEAEIGAEVQRDFIVPTKAVVEISRLLQDNGDVEVVLGNNQAQFQFRPEKGMAASLVTKLVDGVYPNYQQVIPRESKERVPLVREELLQALRRAEIMTSDKSNSAKLVFSENNLLITANTPEVGEARESVAINYRGSEISIAFNPGFLLDALKALDDEEVYLELTDELSPGVLKTSGSFLYVIMPMRMN